MIYTSIPFIPKVTDIGGASQAAQELTTVINNKVSEGWQFKSLETLTIEVKPTGCNTASNKGPIYQNIQLLIFFKIEH